jgi:[glutamine synthetase] adenylyltransferase / [glutamine synthetase]-adenylyl-L-tyrosine phosphorylase
VIVIYDADGQEESEGTRPLVTRPYYARLTQAMITAMTAPTAQGRLYEVDMRLRPSGTQGPVATSWRSFRDYQTDEAWVWEHLALTRARVIAGDPGLGGDIEAFRRDLLARPRPRAKVLTGVADMRNRLAAAKIPDGDWDAKIGTGRLQDIQLLAQAGALLAGVPDRGIHAGLRAGVAMGVLSGADADALARLHDLFWSVVIATRLISDKALDIDTLGEGGAAFLCRATKGESIEALRNRLHDGYGEAATLIDAALARGRKGEDG